MHMRWYVGTGVIFIFMCVPILQSSFFLPVVFVPFHRVALFFPFVFVFSVQFANDELYVGATGMCVSAQIMKVFFYKTILFGLRHSVSKQWDRCIATSSAFYYCVRLR